LQERLGSKRQPKPGDRRQRCRNDQHGFNDKPCEQEIGEQTAVAPLWGSKIGMENVEWRSKDALAQRHTV
jgi:hypothetical protein